MIRKLYQSHDASLDITVGLDLTRLLFGVAYTDAPYNRVLGMRMVAVHLGPVCLTLTRFRVQDEAPPPAPPSRSPTRQSGKNKRRRR